MSVTLVLEQMTLPSTGVVKLQLDYTFDLQISAEEARRRVHTWLVDEVSYMIRAGEPSIVIEESESLQPVAIWRVPAILTATHLGDVGIVGHVDIGVGIGEIRTPKLCAAAILKAAAQLASNMPAYVPPSDMPKGFAATTVNPTRTAPTGNPLEILQLSD